MTRSDCGKYWCGAGRGGRGDISSIVNTLYRPEFGFLGVAASTFPIENDRKHVTARLEFLGVWMGG